MYIIIYETLPIGYKINNDIIIKQYNEQIAAQQNKELMDCKKLLEDNGRK